MTVTAFSKSKHLTKSLLEYKLPSGGRIDVLGREKKTNAFVVIELKKLAVDPVGQIHGYLDEAADKLASRETPKPEVKGIIITGQPNAVLERSLAGRISDYPVSWFLYGVKPELVERASTPQHSADD